MKRNIVQKNEGKLSVLQIIGFCLMVLGIAIIFISSFMPPPRPIIPAVISVSFFVTMLGFAFSFPSLLEGNEGLSTMRIIVFMITNVICMLLLKIGWADGIRSLADIRLDQYWVGIIAFVFGAKATQSFFESRMAKTGKEDLSSESNIDDLPVANEAIITEALKEKGKEWVESFPYVTGMSVRNKITDNKEKKKAALIFKVTEKPDELDYGIIPEYLPYTSRSNHKYKILTDVVVESITEGNSEIVETIQPYPLGNSVSRESSSTGSIGLLVKKEDDPNSDYIVSCYHVFCAPELRMHNKTFEGDGNQPLLSPGVNDNGTDQVGVVIEGVMNTENDFAVARVDNGVKIDSGMLTLGVVPLSFGFVFPENKGETLTMCGRTSGVRRGRIKSHSASQTVYYFKKTVKQYLEGLIEVEPFCTGGDSGGVVINEQDEIVGLIVASNKFSSYVLPVQEFLIQKKYSL